MGLLEDSYISYLNLSHRTDRKIHIEKELKKVGIKAVRTQGKLPNEFDLTNPKLQVMKNRRSGAIGCHYGQVAIMEEALKQKRNAFVFEDDVELCSDFHERIKIAEDFLNGKDWTVFWLGGTYHLPHDTHWHKLGHSSDMPQCRCRLGVDVEKTESKYLVKTYGCFSTFCYIVNKDKLKDVITFLETNVHLSMGIDWEFILLQPYINSYSFVPGIARQIDNESDIGGGMTIFSGFSRLGNHWFQKLMSDFNYDNFKI